MMIDRLTGGEAAGSPSARQLLMKRRTPRSDPWRARGAQATLPGGASLLVDLVADEVMLLVEMVADLGCTKQGRSRPGVLK
jgi:hypothetical protein